VGLCHVCVCVCGRESGSFVNLKKIKNYWVCVCAFVLNGRERGGSNFESDFFFLGKWEGTILGWEGTFGLGGNIWVE
jgi:hypothetical protein